MFSRLEEMGTRLRNHLNDLFKKSDQAGQVTGEGSLFRIMMVDRPLRSYRDSIEPDADARCYQLFVALLDAGIMIGSNGLACLSTPMGETELGQIEAAFERALFTLDKK
jgi:glutamate-1-semialdehyde 2,1-aminomutase